ncbi:hypothetical protein DFP73DRAFT_630352 [Morchella snyderi]|nr:hypothetical protein DFP73DRAFT_630352 [Morchella snyderi]
MNSTIAPVAPSFTFARTLTLHARADRSANVDRVITITTSIAGLVVAIISLVLGYIYWKRSKKASSQTPLPINYPCPLPRSVDARHVIHPTPTEHESDPELARVATIHPELEVSAESTRPNEREGKD